MTLMLDALGSQAGQWLWAGFLVFLRVSAVAALMPGFGEQAVPPRIKLAIAICFTLIVLPAVAPQMGRNPADLIGALRQAGPEVVAGLVFGIVLRMFIMALQIAGTIAAQSASLAQLFGGGPGAEPQPAIGHLLVIGGIALAAILGLHVRAAAYLIESYALIPPGTLPTPDLILTAGLDEVARSFALGFTLAAPACIIQPLLRWLVRPFCAVVLLAHRMSPNGAAMKPFRSLAQTPSTTGAAISSSSSPPAVSAGAPTNVTISCGIARLMTPSTRL